MKKLLLLISCIFLFACGNAQRHSSEAQRPIGIISAMDYEIKHLLNNADIIRSEEVGGVIYHIGTLRGRNVVIVRAGIGKTLSAASAAILAYKYNVSHIIFTGVAGGVGEGVGVLDVVIATELVTHDFGTQGPDGFFWRPGPGGIESITAAKNYVNLAYDVAVSVVGSDRVHRGVVATGDQFIASVEFVYFLRRQFNALACEMEGSSVALVARKFDIPFMVIRTMSDKADGRALADFRYFVQTASDISSEIVLGILENL